MKTKFAGLIASIALFGTASVPALAAPLTQLYFTQSSGFYAPNPTTLLTDNFALTHNVENTQGLNFNGFTNPTGGNPYPTNTYSDMSWGGTNFPGPSSLNVTTYNDGSGAISVPTIGGPAQVYQNDGLWLENTYYLISSLNQVNRAIGYSHGSPNPLWENEVLSNLRIFSDAGHTTNIFSDLNSKTKISFNETSNASCAFANPLGTPCDDIYTVSLTSFAPVVFAYGGHQYELEFGVIPLTNTSLICSSDVPAMNSGLACSSVTTPPGTLQAFTEEKDPGYSSVGVVMAWHLVPEPTSLALFGLALVGLGGVSRGRKTRV